jgi:hypothetical protein
MTTWRLELWSTLEAAGGIRLAPIAFPRDVRERRTTDGEHTLSFALPWHHPAERPIGSEVEVNFRLGQVVRFVKGPDDWTEHRIGNVTARRSSRGKERLIVANGVLQELAVRGLVFRSQAGGHTPASFEVLGLTVPEHLDTYILPALESARQFFWSRGAVEYLTPVDVTYDRDTPLSALRKLQAAAGGLELDITRIATGYALNLVRQIGAGDEPLVVSARRNLTSLGFEAAATEQATRIYAYGAGYGGHRAIIGDAEWNIVAWSFDAARPTEMAFILGDPVGGPGPIQYDGQFVPPDPGEVGEEPIAMERHFLHILETDPPRKLEITQTVAATQAVWVEYGGGAIPESIGTHDQLSRVRIEADGSGTRVNFVERPDMAFTVETGVRTAVLARDDVPYTNNLTPNPLGRVWPAGATVPSYWERLGPSLTVTRETDPKYWENGGQAIRCAWSGTNANLAGLRGPRTAIRLDAQGYLSFMARVTTLVGRVRVSLYVARPDGSPQFGDGHASIFYLVPEMTGSFTGEEVLPDLTNIELGVPESIGLNAAWDLSKYSLMQGEAYIVISPGRDAAGNAISPCEFIVHGVQITNTASNLPLLEGTGGTRLHQLANARLAIYSEPAESVQVNFADLALGDPFTPAVSLGRPIEIRDPDLGLALATRITGYTRDWTRRRLPEVQLANQRAGLTRLLTARSTPVRALPTLNTPGTRGLTYEP